MNFFITPLHSRSKRPKLQATGGFGCLIEIFDVPSGSHSDDIEDFTLRYLDGVGGRLPVRVDILVFPNLNDVLRVGGGTAPKMLPNGLPSFGKQVTHRAAEVT